MRSTVSRLRWLPILVLFLACSCSVQAKTTQFPEWFRFSAALSGIPQGKAPVTVIASVTALLGDLQGIEVRLLLPPGWTPASQAARLARLPAGSSHGFRFEVTPAGPLPNGSIGCSLSVRVPREALADTIRRDHPPEEAAGMVQTLERWPDITNSFTDISFGLFPEEGFYPLGSDMWLDYDDRLKPEGARRGPVWYRDPLITLHQAQTDVEMYDKLQGLLKTDTAMAAKLADSGVDLSRKKQDQLLGLYMMAADAYGRGDFPGTRGLLARLTNEVPSGKEAANQDLLIAAGNLEGLACWSLGKRREAEEALRKAFYLDRKHPLQRYLLRNQGLLALTRGEKANAREMFRLALGMKPAYTLLAEEVELARKP
jgi:hypothetical protein